MPIQDTIRTLAEAWPGSELPLAGFALQAEETAASGPGPILPWVVGLSAIATILFLPNILYAVEGGIGIFLSEARRREVMSDNSFKRGADIAFFIAVPCYALLLTATRASAHSFWQTLLILSLWLLLREAAFRIMGWFRQDAEIAESGRYFRTVFLLATVGSLPALLVAQLIPASVPGFSSIYIAVIAAGALFAYLFKSYTVILRPGFSHFFSFLYLCAFDVIPIAVVVKLLVL